MNPRSFVLTIVVTAAFSSTAAAHLTRTDPPSRYGGGVLKEGPCGVFGGGRTEKVTELEPGATIDVVWNEYVDHPGHFRVAFDIDGDDDFVDPLCLAGCNSRSPDIELYSNETVLLDGIADTVGGRTSIQVQLPDVECERCTLQAIQVMYDKPPYVIPGNDIYYQCADLRLRRSASRTPTPIPSGCVGDCNGDGEIRVNELVLSVRIALGISDLSSCPPGDAHGDGIIQVDDIVASVLRSLEGCAFP